MHLNLVQLISPYDQPEFHASTTLHQGFDPLRNLRVPSTELQSTVRHIVAQHVPLRVQGHNIDTHSDVDEPDRAAGFYSRYTADGLSEMTGMLNVGSDIYTRD